METQILPTVVPSNSVDRGVPARESGIPAEIATPPVKLSARERKLWDHVTTALLECGLIHRTDALMLTVICRTFIGWVGAEEQLQKIAKENELNPGSYMVTTPNGFEQPHQMYYVARDLKKQLLQWLPEAALTIGSFHKIKSDELRPEQGMLFDDPVDDFRKRGAAMKMRAVPSGN